VPHDRQHTKVLGSIVPGVSIDVVRVLARKQSTADLLLQDPPVLVHPLAGDSDASVLRFASTDNALGFRVALLRAVPALTCTTRRERESLTAAVTDHGETGVVVGHHRRAA